MLVLIAAPLILLRQFELQRNVQTSLLLGSLESLALYLATDLVEELFPIGRVLGVTWLTYLPAALSAVSVLIELRDLSKKPERTN